MHITKLQSAAVGSVYICGAVAGALVFGHLSDRFGRKRLFVVIPLVYLGASVAATLCWSYATFAACVCAIGFGIGGEYAALNSALNEFIPARVRGTVDVVVNGTYWLGAGLAALASGPLFDEAVLPADAGWRTAYGLTAALGTAVVALRLYLPESPRWLVMQDRPEDAERVMREIEAAVARHTRRPLPACTHSVTVKVGMRASALRLLRILSCDYAGRSVLCLALMVSQAFFYNAIYFTYVSVLTVFQDVQPSDGGVYVLPFACGNFLGSVLLSRLFDVVGRKPMIVGTYTLSALLLGITALLFLQGHLTAVTQTLAFSAVFFVASAAASSAMLTVSEVFPLEIRARAISVFWGLGTGAGGIAGPVLFGYLIEAAERAHHKGPIVIGYGVGAALMLAAAAVAACLGIDCEGQSLENIASDVHDIAVSGSADPLFGDGGYEGLSAAGPSSVGGAGHVQDQPWASEA